MHFNRAVGDVVINSTELVNVENKRGETENPKQRKSVLKLLHYPSALLRVRQIYGAVVMENLVNTCYTRVFLVERTFLLISLLKFKA